MFMLRKFWSLLWLSWRTSDKLCCQRVRVEWICPFKSSKLRPSKRSISTWAHAAASQGSCCLGSWRVNSNTFVIPGLPDLSKRFAPVVVAQRRMAFGNLGCGCLAGISGGAITDTDDEPTWLGVVVNLQDLHQFSPIDIASTQAFIYR